MELGVNKFHQMSFGYIDSTTIYLAINCKSNKDWLTIGNILQKQLTHWEYPQKFSHWLQQKTTVNGTETYWPPHLSFLVWLRAACISKRLWWHHRTGDSPLPLVTICHKSGNPLPPLGCDVICGRPLDTASSALCLNKSYNRIAHN